MIKTTVNTTRLALCYLLFLLVSLVVPSKTEEGQIIVRSHNALMRSLAELHEANFRFIQAERTIK